MSSFRKRDSMGLYDECEPIPLPQRFAHIKKELVSGHEGHLVQSWQRLVHALRQEIDDIARRGSECIPTMDFHERNDPAIVESFSRDLRRRGVAVLRGVLSPEDARSFDRETHEYLAANPQSTGLPPDEPQLFDLYWSPAQVKARAHPEVLEAQKFVMGTMWHSTGPCAPVSPEHAVTYADRLQVRRADHPTSSSSSQNAGSLSTQAHVDDGSVERWEPEGYGRSGTYDAVFRGRWEDHDPWDYAPRHRATTDLYHRAGACSMFRMFHGWLCLSAGGADTSTNFLHGEESRQQRPLLLKVCPALKLTTAYFLLRPLFAPPSLATGGGGGWTLADPQDSILHGALPSYTQELSSALHPHLELHRSLVGVPPLGPGDWLIWHPDAVHAYPGSDDGLYPPEPSSRCSAQGHRRGATLLHIPACPLTQSNALFLTRQRKAFLLGLPGPDFESGRGERDHAGRPGVSEVNESGGEDGLRAMGLLPFEESDAKTDAGRQLAGIANALLFPDRFDTTCGRLS